MKLLTSSLFVFLFFCGCVSQGYLRNPTSTIWEPTTEFGKTFKQKHIVEFQSMINDIRKNKMIADIMGIVFKGVGEDSVKFYYGAAVGTYKQYNSQRTMFEERAASVASEHVIGILQIISRQQKPLSDSSISGVCVSIAWATKDFTDNFSTERREMIFVYIDKSTLSSFSSFKITNQDLFDRSTIVGVKNEQLLGRIQINLGKSY